MHEYQTKDFDYVLPAELIAQQPLPQRTASRLLHVNPVGQTIEHLQFANLLDLLRPNDLLVFNDTKVIPARLFGAKATGGKIECLIERVLPNQQVMAHIRASKAPPIDSCIVLANAIEASVVDRQGDLFQLQIHHKQPILELLEQYGEVPLPPYIERTPDEIDKDRYQTIYARQAGAVAAPTAGLHFDDELLAQLTAKQIAMTYVTLHVGAGTFQPVRVDNLDQHKMHSEYMELNNDVCDAVAHCKSKEGRVIAVGTTAVRSLETAAKKGELKPYTGETDLFIRPGYQFQCVDVLVTNFHLPQSTLLMLVTALGGYDLVMRAYQEAIAEKYRFFSYGDAMFVSASRNKM